MPWTAPPPPLPPPAFWEPFWVVPLVLPADDDAFELLLCETLPLLEPGLRIDTLIAVLLGFFWVEVADESADWLLPATWPMPWAQPPATPPLCGAAGAGAVGMPAVDGAI